MRAFKTRNQRNLLAAVNGLVGAITIPFYGFIMASCLVELLSGACHLNPARKTSMLPFKWKGRALEAHSLNK
jgi:hypothetical protein